MKALQYILVLTAAFLAASLSSCESPVDPRAVAIGNLLINYGERHKVITKEEADLVREAGLIVLTPTPATIETASGK